MQPRKLLQLTVALAFFVQTVAPVRAQTALPAGGAVVSCKATIASPSAHSLAVTQGSPRAIIDWNSFSVGAPDSVTFAQPGKSSAVLNRVTGSTPSSVAGQVSGDGQVFLVNPNGIAIAPTGNVRVGGGFVGSTLDITNGDFRAGKLDFKATAAPAAISNAGTITAGSGGFVGLLGGTVSNSGTIRVPVGRVGLGAARQATLDPSGDGFLQVAVPSGATTADGHPLVDVSGTISAPGGKVEISAATALQTTGPITLSGTTADAAHKTG